MKGMRAAADPSPQPLGQQQLYVGLKKTLELDDDGNGNKWRAHEYTRGNDHSTAAHVLLKKILRDQQSCLTFGRSLHRRRSHCALNSKKINEKMNHRRRPTKRKEDEPPLAAEAFTKRPKIAPKKSPVRDHMTKVHVKVAATTNKDGTQRSEEESSLQSHVCHLSPLRPSVQR
jgi:hypothetical protein